MNIKTAVHNRLMKIQGLLRQIYHKYRVVKRMKIIHQRKPRSLLPALRIPTDSVRSLGTYRVNTDR